MPPHFLPCVAQYVYIDDRGIPTLINWYYIMVNKMLGKSEAFSQYILQFKIEII